MQHIIVVEVNGLLVKMVLNKKAGLMIGFLTTLLIAIIIFAPACYFAGKVFKTSTQAKDNFVDFAHDIEDLYLDGRSDEHRSKVLIMDEETAIVYFNSGADKVLVDVDAAFPNTNYEIHLTKPSQCDDDQNCLCLFRKVEYDTEIIAGKINIRATRVLCNNINYTLQLESCSLGTPHTINSYQCKAGGFFIERNLAKESSWAVGSYYENPRRRNFQLIKQDSVIRIVG